MLRLLLILLLSDNTVTHAHVQIIPAHSEQVPSEDWHSFSFVSVPAQFWISTPLLIVLGGEEHRPPVMAYMWMINTLKFKECSIANAFTIATDTSVFIA